MPRSLAEEVNSKLPLSKRWSQQNSFPRAEHFGVRVWPYQSLPVLPSASEASGNAFSGAELLSASWCSLLGTFLCKPEKHLQHEDTLPTRFSPLVNPCTPMKVSRAVLINAGWASDLYGTTCWIPGQRRDAEGTFSSCRRWGIWLMGCHKDSKACQRKVLNFNHSHV